MKQKIKHFRALNKWFSTPLGINLANEFTRELKRSKDYLRGETLLQLGSCGNNQWLKQLNYIHKWVATPFSIKSANHIECTINHLPIDRSSVDCIIAPLTLEAFSGNFNLLDEIDRVLNPMGHVVFLGINPWSLWGAAIKLGRLDLYNDRITKMRTATNINRAFTQRGFNQRLLTTFCYIPPINNPNIINHLSFLDEVGKMIWPFPSGVYCYIAQKYELITPSLTRKSVQEMIPSDFHPVIS